jgi:hypothetical protein
MLISDKKIEILKALARYKYITASQVIELGISSSLDSMRKYLTDLKNKELVKSTAYSGVIQVNNKSKLIRYEDLYFLDKNGVHFLQKTYDLDDIKHPTNYKLNFSNDYVHRVLMVSICISFDKWRKEKDIKGSFLIDFHNQETLIKVDEKLTVKPDIIINFNGIYYIIEVWAGIEKEYITSKLGKLTKALATKKISEFLSYEKIPRIINVFKDPNTMERVKQELQTDSYFESAVSKGLFYFSTFEDIKQNFDNWQNIRW